MEVLPGVHMITVGESPGPGLFPPNSYLVVGSRGSVLVDAGWNRPEHIRARLDYIRRHHPPPLAAIVVTHRHPDHVGGAGAIAQATGAPVYASPAEREAIDGVLEREGAPVRVGYTPVHGERLDLGDRQVEFLHTPGHTLGSLSALLHPGGVLFTGDTVLGMGSTVVSPEEGDMALYMESLRTLLACGASVICPGHGPLVRAPAAKLRELLQHRLEREGQILDALRRGPKGVEDLRREIYPEVGSHLYALAQGQIRAHLRKLEKEGRVVVRDNRYSLVG
jgi:ribonuclease/clavin/mitogillin